MLVEMSAIGHDLEPNTTNCTDPTEVRHVIVEDDDSRRVSLFCHPFCSPPGRSCES